MRGSARVASRRVSQAPIFTGIAVVQIEAARRQQPTFDLQIEERSQFSRQQSRRSQLPRGLLRAADLCLLLAQMPRARRLCRGADQQSTDGLLCPGPAHAGCAPQRCDGAAGRCERQRLGLHARARAASTAAPDPAGAAAGTAPGARPRSARMPTASWRRALERAFASIDELARARPARRGARCSRWRRAGALAPLSAHRHEASWHALGVERLPGLLDGLSAPEPPAPLPAPSEGENILADYRHLGLTTGRHPLALLRPRLLTSGLLAAVAICSARRWQLRARRRPGHAYAAAGDRLGRGVRLARG